MSLSLSLSLSTSPQVLTRCRHLREFNGARNVHVTGRSFLMDLHGDDARNENEGKPGKVEGFYLLAFSFFDNDSFLGNDSFFLAMMITKAKTRDEPPPAAATFICTMLSRCWCPLLPQSPLCCFNTKTPRKPVPRHPLHYGCLVCRCRVAPRPTTARFRSLPRPTTNTCYT